MPEARTVTFNEDDLEARASYDDFEPGEYRAVLTDIKDAKATKTGNTGLRWVFQVYGLDFSITTWDKGGGGWKLAEVLRGLGEVIEPNKPVRVSPSKLLGREATVKIGYDSSAKRDDFLTVLRVLPSGVEMPGEELYEFDTEDSAADNDPYAGHYGVDSEVDAA